MWKNLQSLVIALIILAVLVVIVVGIFWLIPVVLILAAGVGLFIVVRIFLEEVDSP
tara:strand:+ start:4949 stop:5116 length:168 start_codon:yes stop_codon:yes gene_type:complete